MQRCRKLFFAVLLPLGVWSCARQKIPRRDPPVAGSDVRKAPLDKSPFGLMPPLNAKNFLLEEELMETLSLCHCAPQTSLQVLQALAQARGVLPQVLVPDVRKQIISDPKLAKINELPSELAEALTKWFAGDDDIALEIRKSLSDRLSSGMAGGTTLASRLPIRFDGFVSVAALKDQLPLEFNLNQMLPRWDFVLAVPNLWQNLSPVDGIDHGLQVLESLRIMMEWSYLWGIAPDPSEVALGGLSFDPSDAQLNIKGAFDPRREPGVMRAVSGTYRVDYAQSTSVKLATSIKERWLLRGDQNMNLAEQARLWRVSAQAFSLWRPDKRINVAGLFGEKAVFPDSAHELALVFIHNLSFLLQGPLIDKTSRQIFTRPRRGPNDVPPTATPEELLELAMTLHTWMVAAEQPQNAQLDQDVEERLQKLPQDVTPALQLILQTLLSQFTRPLDTDDPALGEVMVGRGGSGALSLIGPQTIATLAAIEHSAMKSPYLQERLLSLLRGHGRELTEFLTRGLVAPVSPLYVAWWKVALEQLKNQHDIQEEFFWLETALSEINQLFATWDRS